jgi:hypothetical protein
VAHAYNSKSWGTEAGRPWIQGKPVLYSETLSQKKKTIKNTKPTSQTPTKMRKRKGKKEKTLLTSQLIMGMQQLNKTNGALPPLLLLPPLGTSPVGSQT